MILVTGSSGMLGVNLAITATLGTGTDVVGVDIEPGVTWPGIESIELDLMDREGLKRLLDRYKPGWIIHCAALTNVDRCQESPENAYRLNVGATAILAELAKEISARVVYISTDSIFNGNSGGYCENDTPDPLNVYAQTKLEGEATVLDASGENLIIRTNIYGWNMQNKMSLAEWVLDRLESKQEIPGFPDVIFNPILVNDLSDSILDLMGLDSSGVFHLTGAQSCSKFEFAVELADVFGLKRDLVRPVSIKKSALGALRPRNTSFNTSKAASVLGKPLPDVRSGLIRFRELRETGFVAKLKAMKRKN